jgi:hypothetical protein
VFSGYEEMGETSGTPAKLGQCTRCGKTYPIRYADASWYPVGTDGTCICGGDEFVPFE